MGFVSVLIMILKYLGIAVLLLLVLLLVLLLLILLCSVKYEAEGVYSDKENRGRAFVKWLFGLAYLEVSYNGGDASVRYGFPMKKIFSRLIFGEEKKKTHKPDETEDKSVVKIASVEEKKEQPKITHKKQHKLKKKDKNISVTDRIKELFHRIIYYYDEYEVKKLFDPVNRFLRRFLKALGLSKMKADITFGFDDPALTGMVLGGGVAAAAFMPFDIDLDGYFDGQYLDGKAYLKGKTCALRLIIPFVRAIVEKPVWNVIMKILDTH